MMNTVGSNQHTNNMLFAYQNTYTEKTVISPDEKNNQDTFLMDRVTLQKNSIALTYTGSLALNTNEDSQYSLLRQLVAGLLQEQGIDTLAMGNDHTLEMTDLTPDEAQELVADDGYFGIEKTSERIIQFAIGIAGGDATRIDAIREGIDQGFQEALDAFGGWLPDISYDTYDAVMEKLDQWVVEAHVSA